VDNLERPNGVAPQQITHGHDDPYAIDHDGYD
jgi:hypothetical protein